MRMQMNIRLENQERIMKLLQESGKKTKPIIKKAVNEAAGKAKEKIYSGAKQEYTVKRSVFSKKDLSIKKATVSRLYAQLEVSGSPLSLSEAYKTAKNGKRAAAKAAIKRGALKSLQKGNLKGFVSQMQSSHKGIFQRTPGKYMKKHSPRPYKKIPGKTTKGREAIKELMGPSVSKLSETVYRPMEGELQEGLNKALLNFIDEAFKA